MNSNAINEKFKTRTLARPVVLNLFWSIAALQELCHESPPTHDFSVVQNIIVF